MDISKYVDFQTEIDPVRLQDVESRIRTLLKHKWIDLDTNPSSVFGNLFITPAARVIALLEQATDCMLGDINLENVLNGIVCDCDFVQQFLKGLGVNSLAEVNTTSMVRIIFNTDQTYYIDQGELLLFNNDYVFSFVHGNNPTIQILPSSYSVTNLNKTNNVYILSKGASYFNGEELVVNQLFVDLPVYGPATADVTAGTTATIDPNFGSHSTVSSGKTLAEDYILDISMLHPVTPLTIPTNLSELVELVQKIQPTSAITTKAGAISYIENKYPHISGVSVVSYGDEELYRTNLPTFGSDSDPIPFAYPLADIYTKGSGNLVECEELINGSDNHLQHIPIRWLGFTKLASAQSTNDTEVDLNGALPFTKVTPSGRFENNTTYNLDSSVTSTYTKVRYLFDPVQEAITKTLESKAVGSLIDIKSKLFYPVEISNFWVYYKKQPGKYFDRQLALDEIYNFINNLTYPVTYDDAYITDIMLANGATSVDQISSEATLLTAPGNNSNNLSLTNLNIEQLKNQIVASNTDKALYPALFTLNIGPKNIQYTLQRENIYLIEKTV